MSWFAEGTAHRSPVRREPVIHVLVEGGDGWVLWCSGGKGRPDSPSGKRLCGRCRGLMRESFDSGDVDARETRRWLTDEQYTRGTRRDDSNVTEENTMAAKINKTRVVESVGDPGKWQAQYRDPVTELWHDIGDAQTDKAQAVKREQEYRAAQRRP